MVITVRLETRTKMSMVAGFIRDKSEDKDKDKNSGKDIESKLTTESV